VADADDGELRNAFADAQAQADAVAAQWGGRAPAPLVGESLRGYRRRLIRPFQKYSAVYKGVDLTKFPDVAFDQAEVRVYADAAAAASDPDGVPTGTLRAVTERAPAGHAVTRFVGHPSAWMLQFMPATRSYCTKIDPHGVRQY
jgi:hypothetical protein